VEHEASSALKDAASFVSEISDEKLGSKDALQLKEKLSELKHKFDSRPRRGRLSQASEATRNALVECLKSNPDRPLNCTEEFEKFKDHVKSIEAATL
jgi:altered-inheritance-of-mitochondria protein 13